MERDTQIKKAITANLDRYGNLKFNDAVFAAAYEKEGKKQLNIERYGLNVLYGSPYIDSKELTVKRQNGEVLCVDYPRTFRKYPALLEIYEAAEKL